MPEYTTNKYELFVNNRVLFSRLLCEIFFIRITHNIFVILLASTDGMCVDIIIIYYVIYLLF
jgi:hypothetical protein